MNRLGMLRLNAGFDWRKIALILAATAIYVLAFIASYPVLGPAGISLAFFPVAVAAWLTDWRAGMMAGLLCVALNMLLLALVGQPGWETIFTRGATGSVLLAVGGALVGWQSGLLRRVRQQSLELAHEREALRESEEQYRQLVEQSRDAIYVLGVEEGNNPFEFVNAGFETMFGYSAAEVTDPDFGFKHLVAPESLPLVEGRQQQRAVGQIPDDRLEFVALNKAGNRIEVEASLTTLTYGGKPAVQGILRDITKRKRAEAQLTASEERYRAVSELTTDYAYAYHFEDGHAVIEWVTGAFYRITGYTQDEIGMPGGWERLVYPDDTPRLSRHYDILRANQMDVCEYRIVTKDGQIRWLRDHARPVWDEEMRGMVRVYGAAQDITERKQVEAAESEQRVLVEALRDTAEILNQTLDLDEVLDHILTAVARVVPHDSSMMMSLDEDTDLVTVTRTRGYSAEQVAKITGPKQAPFEEMRTLRQMVETGQPLVIPDTAAHPDWVRLSEWVHSYVGAPIHVDGKVIGFLNLNSRTVGHFLPGDGERLLAFANQAGIAIKNARLYWETMRQAREMTALYHMSLEISKPADLPDRLWLICEWAARLIAVDKGGLYLYHEATQELELVISYKLAQDFTGMRIRLGEGISGRVVQTGQPLIIEDYSTWDGRAQSFDADLFATVIGVPLQWQERVVGAITLGAERGRRDFTSDDLRLLSLFAQQAAIVIENARLLEQVQQYASELELRVAERTAEIQEQHRRLNAVLASVADAVIVTDLDGRIIEANPVAKDLLGVASSGANLGRRIEEVVVHLSAKQVPDYTEVLDVGSKTFQAKAAKVLDADQESGTVIVLRDVTPFLALDRMKTKFVDNVSHELRTPLTNIKLYVSLLRKGKPERRDEYMEVIDRETARLARLINDLLDVSRLKSAKRNNRRVKVKLDVGGLIEQVIENHMAQANVQRITLLCESSNEALPRIMADRDQIVQMLTNLVGNALAYTPEGGAVHVRSALGATPEKGDGIVIEVSDTGMGIPPEDTDHIFDRFFRGPNVAEGQIPGTGLGLAITAEIVKLHYGKISVESVVNEGSTFQVYLPLKTPD